MTNFNRSGFNPLRPNPNAPQQNRPIDSPAQEPQSSSRPAGHPEAGPSDTRQEARPQNYPSAADVAIHQRARFDQQRGDAVARADAPEAPTRQTFLLKIRKGLEPYKEGKTLHDCAIFSDNFWGFENYFYAKGELTPKGVKLYAGVDPSFQAEIREAIEIRKAVLVGRQSSKQGNVPPCSGNQRGKRPASKLQTEPRLVRQRTDGNPPQMLQSEPAARRGTEQEGVKNAVASAHHERARFFQQRGNVAARTDAPEGPTRRPPPSSLPKILKGLKPYQEGETLQACEVFTGYQSFSHYFYTNGGLRPLGEDLYERVDPSTQAEIMKAIEIRQAVLARRQSSKQENVQNATTTTQVDPVEQELAGVFANLPDLMPDIPELNLSSQQQSGNAVARADVPKASTKKKPPPKSLPKILKGLEPYQEGKTLQVCADFADLPFFRSLFHATGGLTKVGQETYDRLEPADQGKFKEAIEMRKAVMERGQSSKQGAVQNAAAQTATHERARFFQQSGNAVAQADAPEASTRRPPPPTPSDGWQMPETPQGGWDQSRLPPSYMAPEIVDVDNYPSPPAATVSVAQRLANDPWLRDNDFVSYTQMLAELLRGQPRADWLQFVDPLEVQLLLNGDPAALHRLTDPNTPPILFLPVNNNNIHWSLLVVNRETKQAFHYDSMASPASAYLPSHPTSQFSMASQVANALAVRAPMEMPMAQQPDTYSCGDYVLTGIEELAHRMVSGEAFQDGGMALSMIQPNRDHIISVLTHVEQFERGMPELRLSSQPRNVPSAPSHLEPATRRGADDMT